MLLLRQQIIDTIKQLPEEKLAEVVDFVTFLKEKYQSRTEKNIVKLGGLWEWFEPTDEEIQEARKEIWQHLEREKLCHIGVEDIFGNWLTQMSL